LADVRRIIRAVSRAHQKHHFNPYDRDYCITTGWLNPLFEAIDYWRRIEDAIESITGAVVRTGLARSVFPQGLTGSHSPLASFVYFVRAFQPRKDDQNWAQPGAAPKQE
jgi:hypothetical protein